MLHSEIIFHFKKYQKSIALMWLNHEKNAMQKRHGGKALPGKIKLPR